MLLFVKKLLDYSEYLLNVLIVIITCLLIICVSCEVFFRFVLRSPLRWSMEMATQSFIWWVYLGSALALKKKRHLSVEYFRKRLPTRVKKYFIKFLYFLIIVYNAVILYWAIKTLPLYYVRVTSITRISELWIFLIIPVSFLLMFMYSIQLFFEDVDIPDTVNHEIEQ